MLGPEGRKKRSNASVSRKVSRAAPGVRSHHPTPTTTTRCRVWCRRTCTFLFSHVGMFILVVGYSVAGAFAFRELEGGNERAVAERVANRSRQAVVHLWNVTLHLNVLFKPEWERQVDLELIAFQRDVVEAVSKEGYDGNKDKEHWSFSSAFLFSLTVISTIGYGNIAPKTFWGKLCTIFYAIVGIPLMFLYLTNVGSILARAFKYLYGKICCQGCAARPPPRPRPFPFHPHDLSKADSFRRSKVRVPVTVCLLVIGLYICIGAILFSVWQGWNYLDGSYFCFVTLSTIGFGDLVPGDDVVSDEGTQEKLVICSLYLLGGLALIAMCFVLVQEEVVRKFKALGHKIGIIPDSDLED